jgi:hypothetical protein
MTFPAPFAILLRERLVCISFILAGLFLVCTNLLGWKLWLCGFRAFTGLPCPGCGMTRSIASLSKGHWHAGIAYHPFGPLVFIGALLFIIITCLPQRSRVRILPWIARSEQRTGWSIAIIILFMAYGFWRMVSIIRAAY